MDRFMDRKEAGERLAKELSGYRGKQGIVVLGLPRGGVPVAEQIARSLAAPLGVFIVRKVGAPDQRELAMGAIGSGGVRIVNEDIVRSLGISKEEFEAAAEKALQELREREEAYYGEVPDLDLAGKTVVLVDDGIATGATIRVAIKALRRHQPKKLIVAVPVAPPETCDVLAEEVDELICPLRPPNFMAISRWYVDFGQTSDDEVRRILRNA